MSLTFTAAVRANKPKRNVANIFSGKQTVSVAIQKNGKVWGWGWNFYGHLGNNSNTDYSTPINILGAVKTFCKIAVGGTFTNAIDKNGTAWSWGLGSYGELGNNITGSYLTPVSVVGVVKTFCEIGAGSYHCAAIDKNGRAWCWGNGVNGALGNNLSTCRSTPVSVVGSIKTFCKIYCGYDYSVAIDKYGTVWSWGYGLYGQLGDNSSTCRFTPVSVVGSTKTFCEISAGGSSYAIDKNGRAWSWGPNYYGDLGDGTTTSRLTPVSVAGAIKTFCKISGGGNFAVALDKNGRAWAWGYNIYGQLGDGTTTSRLTPVSVVGAVKTFCHISGGQGHTLAIDKNGRAWAWGYNNYTQIGNNSFFSKSTPVAIAGQKKTFCHIFSGTAEFSTGFCGGIDNNGKLWTWGSNRHGILGNNGTFEEYTPVSVAGTTKTFCQISLGTHPLAIDKNGRLWAWGPNNNGQLGDGTTTSRFTPVSVAGAIKTFCKISAGNGRPSRFGTLSFSVAIDKYGRAWGWGSGGSTGDGTTTARLTPVSVAGAIKTFCEINTGYYHTVAITNNGGAWAWGINTNGGLGNNSTTDTLTPVSVAGATKTFCQIDGGQFFSIAIDKYGRAWGWGSGGSTGDGTTTERLTPVSVAGAIKTFCKLSVGTNHTAAIDKNGRAWGWGYNSVGQIGDNSTTSRLTPVSVAGAVKTFCKISAGLAHTTAIDNYGNVWSWGFNNVGQFGNNMVLVVRTPVRVCNI